jgi:GNAT superfamily N-acetyltransferase
MPSITSRDYAGPDDLRVMQSLVQATWTRDSHLHVGDLAWQRVPREPQSQWPTRLWLEAGQIIAWAWVRTGADAAADEDEFYYLVRPDHRALCDAVIDWAEAANPSPRLATPAHQRDALLVEPLLRRGYRPRDYGPFAIHAFRTLIDIPKPALPPGFRAASMVEIGNVERKVAAHRASWSRFAAYDEADPPLVSGMTAARYREMMQTWPYRPELDFGVEGPDGRIVASCTAWLDQANRVGLFEPVGVDPEFRRIGLSRAMCFATLHALKAAGATLATVTPRGDNDYRVPRHAYATMGFVAEGRRHVYQRG